METKNENQELKEEVAAQCAKKFSLASLYRVRGRARRTEFICIFYPCFLLWFAVVVVCALTLPRFGLDPTAAGLVGAAIGAVLFATPIALVVVRRLHDLGLSGLLFWALAGLLYAPVSRTSLAPIAMTCLAFWPGSRGPNRYGPNPRFESDENEDA